VSVPNVIGLSEARAEDVVTGAGLVFGDPIMVRLPDRPEGTVVAQEPGAGSSVAPGSTVIPTVSTQRELVAVPDVIGMSEAEALVTLSSAGLKLTGSEEVRSPTVAAGQVVASDPPAGTTVAVGTGVDLTVAASPDASESQPTTTATPSP
jgi:beta-lactam-binding protein with PASTA domain